MKRFIFFFISIVVALTSYASSTSDVVNEAIELYNQADYRTSIKLLEAEVATQKEEGKESGAVYYNLGNAYYRIGDIAKSRLNYERALLLMPNDKDTRHNIEFLKSKMKDRIDISETIFIKRWVESIQNLLSVKAWSVLSVVLIFILTIALGMFFFLKEVKYKKIAFYIGVVVLIFIILANLLAGSKKEKFENQNSAIIISESVNLMSAPLSSGSKVIELHEGAKIKITKTDGDWLEIELENGVVGWLENNNIEVI